MQFIKSVLLTILVFVCGAAGLYVAANRGLLPTNVMAVLNSGPFQKLKLNVSDDVKQQTNILTNRSVEVGRHASQVLGAQVKVNEDKPPIHERAWEYTRYIYCQEVVKDYEERYETPASSTPEPSPSPEAQ